MMRISNPGSKNHLDGFILVDALIALFLLSFALLLIFTGVRASVQNSARIEFAIAQIIETHNRQHILPDGSRYQ